MADMVFAVPILPGKTEAYMAWIEEMKTGDDFKALLKQAGLTRMRIFLQQTPDGEMAIVIHEGPNAHNWMEFVAENSSEPLLKDFFTRVSEIHGINPERDGPQPPTPELVLDLNA